MWSGDKDFEENLEVRLKTRNLGIVGSSAPALRFRYATAGWKQKLDLHVSTYGEIMPCQ